MSLTPAVIDTMNTPIAAGPSSGRSRRTASKRSSTSRVEALASSRTQAGGEPLASRRATRVARARSDSAR